MNKVIRFNIMFFCMALLAVSLGVSAKPKEKIYAEVKGPVRKGCVGKQNYFSRGACWSCPKGYKRYSPTRKMSHPAACKKRGLGFNKKTTKATKAWSPAVGCPKGQFKHFKKCKRCPKGTRRIANTGACRKASIELGVKQWTN